MVAFGVVAHEVCQLIQRPRNTYLRSFSTLEPTIQGSDNETVIDADLVDSLEVGRVVSLWRKNPVNQLHSKQLELLITFIQSIKHRFSTKDIWFSQCKSQNLVSDLGEL